MASVSVLIACHKRRIYLVDAIKSVLAQDVPRSDYQVVVVKDFEDPEIDEFLCREGVVSLLCTSIEGGSKVAYAASYCTGDVISFLDDDDFFEPNKIREVTSRFRADSSLIYYHNNQRFVFEDRSSLSSRDFRSSHARRIERIKSVYIPASHPRVGLNRLALVDPSFNSSSISMRRSAFLELLPAINGAFSTDAIYFFGSLALDGALLVDRSRLTVYRVHQGNILSTSSASNPRVRSPTEVIGGMTESYSRAVGLVRADPPALRAAKALQRTFRVWSTIEQGSASRVSMARLLLQIPQGLATYVGRSYLPIYFGGLVYLVSPPAARDLYSSVARVRSRAAA